jgi:hypothetical protein
MKSTIFPIPLQYTWGYASMLKEHERFPWRLTVTLLLGYGNAETISITRSEKWLKRHSSYNTVMFPIFFSEIVYHFHLRRLLVTFFLFLEFTGYFIHIFYSHWTSSQSIILLWLPVVMNIQTQTWPWPWNFNFIFFLVISFKLVFIRHKRNRNNTVSYYVISTSRAGSALEALELCRRISI